jgi:hypothetical protein
MPVSCNVLSGILDGLRPKQAIEWRTRILSFAVTILAAVGLALFIAALKRMRS